MELPRSVKVELVALCKLDGQGQTWWRPDGKVLDKPIYPNERFYPGIKDHSVIELVVRVHGALDFNDRLITPGFGGGSDTGSPVGLGGRRMTKLRRFGRFRPPDADSINLRYEIAVATAGLPGEPDVRAHPTGPTNRFVVAGPLDLPIKEVLVQVGDRVAKGQILARCSIDHLQQRQADIERSLGAFKDKRSDHPEKEGSSAESVGLARRVGIGPPHQNVPGAAWGAG